MRALVLILALVAAGAYGYRRYGPAIFDDKAGCPYCFKTGRVLPAEDVCGPISTRGWLKDETHQHESCFTSSGCRYCGGKGWVEKGREKSIPRGKYVLEDTLDRKAAVPY